MCFGGLPFNTPPDASCYHHSVYLLLFQEEYQSCAADLRKKIAQGGKLCYPDGI